MAMILYCVEIVRYYIGNKIFFESSMKRCWIALAVGSIYFVTVVNNPKFFWYEGIYLMAYISSGLSTFFMIEGTIGEKIFRVISLLCINACLDEVVGILYISGEKRYTLEEKSIIECFITIAILLLLCLFKAIIKKHENKREQWKEKTVIPVIIVISLCLACTVGGLVYTQRNINNQKEQLYLSIIGIVAYECVIGLVIFALYIKNVNKKKKQLIETERMLNEMQKKYYIALLEKEEETREYRHDMNNHLMCLRELVKKNENMEVEKYIEELQEKLFDIKTKCYMTGNEILDILLNNHLSTLENTEILVTGKCKYTPDISNVDFCVIFSNLIKNAVEELERENYKDKYIKVNIKSGSTYLMIEIKNTSSILIKENGKNIRTKKLDGRNHGIGLRNVMETVKKNGGTFFFTGDGKEVCAKVILNIKK